MLDSSLLWDDQTSLMSPWNLVGELITPKSQRQFEPGETLLSWFEEEENPDFNQTFIALDGEIVMMYMMG